MEHAALIQSLNKDLQLTLPEKIAWSELQQALSAYVNELVQHDFEKLVRLLYRIDVSEAKIKAALKNETGINAGDLLANLILERQLQKIKHKQAFTPGSDAGSEEEKW